MAGPTLTDGVVTLVPFAEAHVAAHVAGEDDEIRFWFGQAGPSTVDGMREVAARWAREADEGSRFTFAVEHDGVSVGGAEIRPLDEHSAEASWWLLHGHRGQGHATRALRLLTDWALTEREKGGLGLSRVEAKVEPGNHSSLRVAARSGLRREGVKRVAPGTGDRLETDEYVVFSRLRTDPPLSEPESFRALLNSFLPRKRAIAQMLIRDPDGRVLLCRLTYKQDWDLPGGVVEVGEDPHEAAVREVEEELGLVVRADRLLLTDWLPPWGGWDDALCLVFDGGVHDASVADAIVKQAREIRDAQWCTDAEIETRAADFTARRIRAALASRGGAFAKSGRPWGHSPT